MDGTVKKPGDRVSWRVGLSWLSCHVGLYLYQDLVFPLTSGQAEPTGRVEEAFLPGLDRKGGGARSGAGLSQQILTEASQPARWLCCLGTMLASESKLCD